MEEMQTLALSHTHALSVQDNNQRAAVPIDIGQDETSLQTYLEFVFLSANR